MLSVFDYDLRGAKPIDVFDVLTGDWITRLASVSAASLFFFGVKDRRHIVRKHLGALSGIKWSGPNATASRAVIAEVGQPLVDRPVPARLPHSHSPLNIPGLDLNTLVRPLIYIYNTSFGIVGTFPSFAQAIGALSPNMAAGLTSRQLEVKSRGLQRRCNWHATTDTERGAVYTARHPSLVTRKTST